MAISKALFEQVAADSGVSDAGKFCAYRVLCLDWSVTAAAKECKEKFRLDYVSVSQASRWTAQLRQMLPRPGETYFGPAAAFDAWWARRVVKAAPTLSNSGRTMLPKVSVMALRADYSRWAFCQEPKAPSLHTTKFGQLLREACAVNGAELELHGNLCWWAGIALRPWSGEDWNPPDADEADRAPGRGSKKLRRMLADVPAEDHARAVADLELLPIREDMLSPPGEPIPDAAGVLPEPSSATLPPAAYGFRPVAVMPKGGYGFAPTKKCVKRA